MEFDGVDFETDLVCEETKGVVSVTEYMAGCPLCPKHVREWNKVAFIEEKVLVENVFGREMTPADLSFIAQLLRGEI